MFSKCPYLNKMFREKTDTKERGREAERERERERERQRERQRERETVIHLESISRRHRAHTFVIHLF